MNVPSLPARLWRLLRSQGPLQTRAGLGSGVAALALAVLCLLGVLAFHFPAYLTTPALRALYDVDLMRHLLFWSLATAGAVALFNAAFDRLRWLSLVTLTLVLLAAGLGGHRVPVGDFPDGTLYVGLDWLVLDLLGSALIFIAIERLFALRRDQPVFRPHWHTDLAHFSVNHLLVGVLLLVVNALVHGLFGWAADHGLRGWVQGLPFWAALPLIVLVADVVQYTVHRACHEWPPLWRLHAVHHSVAHMDWLAGSRLHLLEVILVRTAVLAPIFVLGFAKEVVDTYIILAGLQAVFNHANVDVRLGPLRHIIVTPNFHHWHHARDEEGLDRNYAAHYAFLDHLFGTAVRSGRRWPRRNGVVGDYVPEGFVRQCLFPFTWRGR